MKVYLASFFNTRSRLLPIRTRLQEMGYEVTSTWLDEPEGSTDKPSLEASQAFAHRDLTQIADSNLLILDTFDETLRGGREVEYGFAMALGIPTVVVGPRRNVFHFLTYQFSSWEEALTFMEDMSKWESLAIRAK